MADLRASGLGGVPKGATADRPSSPSVGDVFYNGSLGRFEIYTSNGWMAVASSPKPPISVTATDQGSGRAFNNGQASVSFNLSESGGLPTSYTVTSSPGSYTSSGTSSPIIVTGLQSNTSYTYTVLSTNDYGTSSPSSASSAVISTTVPATPSAPTTTNSNGTQYGSAPSQIVSWSAPSNGGSSIIDYTVTRVGGSSQTVAGTSATFTELTSGTSYQYTVTARNVNGSSISSPESSSVTAATVPQSPTIGTATATTPTSVSVSFTAPVNNGNSEITTYTVASSPGGFTASGASSPIVVTGLANSTDYTFTVTATNAIGTSAASASSNSVTTLSNDITVDYLVVAGGGGGNRAPTNNPAGGGGAGGYRTSIGGTALVLNPATAYTISIGAGGAGSTTGTSIAGKGGNSVFHTITATGGGGGAYEGIDGAAGGSGGGDASGSTNPGAGNQGGYSPVEGYAGGQASGDGGGGGGGAGGAAPAAPSASSNGLGGIGSNSASSWATITSSGVNGYYAGGGGGGSYIAGNNTGTGGSGGGGDGKSRFGSAGGGAGVANTGGGGGGAGGNFSENPGNAGPGGNGGSGIVILKYDSFYTPTFNGVTQTTYTDSGYKYTKITAGTGTVTF